MALMLGSLYDALMAGSIPADKAQKAAEEVASYENRLSGLEGKLNTLTWMMGTVITLQVMTLAGLLGLLWKMFPGGPT